MKVFTLKNKIKDKHFLSDYHSMTAVHIVEIILRYASLSADQVVQDFIGI